MSSNQDNIAISRLGFRPFFFIAGASGVAFMVLWLFTYQGILSVANTTPADWHAHEMIFGYASVVIIGFLLTASKNWTGVQTLHGKPLLGLALLWVLGRFFLIADTDLLFYHALIDTGFLVLATFAITYPIVKSQKWRNLVIVSKVFLLACAHIMYYFGLFGVVANGQKYGLYFGFYIIISLLLMMSRRLLPFFITKGLGLQRELKNSKVADLLSLAFFVLFVIADVFFTTVISNILAGLLFVVHAVRAYWWYDKGIWKKPLLWSIYLAYCFLVVGFGLKCASAFVFIMPNLDLHALAFGLGLMSLALMARVSLGHTGRSINEPPAGINLAFVLLVISFICRVILPIFFIGHYIDLVFIAQISWSLSFAIFAWLYTPMLFSARIDGKPG